MTNPNLPATSTPNLPLRLGLGLLVLVGAVACLALLASQLVGCPVAALPEPGVSTGNAPLQLELASDRAAVLRGGDGLVRLELRLLGGAATSPLLRQPTDFVVVLDRSGSMGGDKIVHAREAVLGLIDRLQDGDRFSLVIYDNVSELLIPLTVATADARLRFKSRVAEIVPRGGTALSHGLDSALELLAERRRNHPSRLVLISDGLANEGDTSREGLLGRATKSADIGTPLTSIGVGEDFDEALMGSLADAGSGNYYFLQDTQALAQVFAGELGATRETVAEAVEIEIELAPGCELLDAAGYQVERRGRRLTFRPGSLFAGQDRRLWLTVRVGDGEPGHRELGRFTARYRAAGRQIEIGAIKAPTVAQVDDEATFLAGIRREKWGLATIEEEYGRLQQKVAEYVKSGRRDEAKQEIAEYKAKTAKLNETVGSAEVSANLQSLDALDSKVEDAFTGAASEQRQKQNTLSKTNQAAGWDSRRAGAKKAPADPKGGGQ